MELPSSSSMGAQNLISLPKKLGAVPSSSADPPRFQDAERRMWSDALCLCSATWIHWCCHPPGQHSHVSRGSPYHRSAPPKGGRGSTVQGGQASQDTLKI